MSQSIAPDSLAAIHKIFFDRLAKTNREVIDALIDLTTHIEQRKHHTILGVLSEVDNRLQAMRTTLIFFDEYLEG